MAVGDVDGGDVIIKFISIKLWFTIEEEVTDDVGVVLIREGLIERKLFVEHPLNIRLRKL